MSKKWEVRHCEEDDLYWVETDSGLSVCDLYYKASFDKFHRFADAANHAHLIAAAPEMVELLEPTIEAFEDLGLPHHADTARAILSKIKGE